LKARLALAAALALAGAAAPSERAAPRWSPARVVDLARVSTPRISPDGSSIAYVLSRPRGADEPPGPAHSNLWLVPFDGGAPRRLTSANAEDKAPAWSPDGTRLAFLSARGGEGTRTRVWILPVAGGEPEAITPENMDVLACEWAPHGRSLAWLATDPKPASREKAEKEGRDWTVVDQELPVRRLWVQPLDDAGARAPQRVASAGDRSVWEFDWSPHGNALVATVSDTPRTDDSYIGKRVMILPLGDEAAREIAGVSGKVDQVAWSRDARTIALRAASRPDDPYSGSVLLLPAAGGQPVNITGDRPESVNHIAWLEDGRLALVSVRSVRTALSVVKVTDPSRVVDLVEPGGAVFTSASFSKDGARWAVAGSTRNDPPEVHAGPGRSRRDAPLSRLTRSNPDLDALPRARQEVFGWAASDGLRLEGILMHPAGDARRAAPLVVVVHGGPESQYLDGWNTGYATPAQTLAENECFVFFPNYRGSTGRGSAFARADHRDLGGREMTDVLEGVDALLKAHPIDAARVGITGGSYGGYFTSLGVTRHSDRFAAGVSFFGISNWTSFMGVTDIPVENAQVHWNLWCYEHPELCRQASPIAHIAAARTPTLILQGEKDERVPESQSRELYAALRWKGVPVEYVVFPREKHGFRERAHQLEAMERLLRWFSTHLSF
jgi:dipeptidyl aminopeptidase/acylaminoacyl peptidase